MHLFRRFGVNKKATYGAEGEKSRKKFLNLATCRTSEVVSCTSNDRVLELRVGAEPYGEVGELTRMIGKLAGNRFGTPRDCPPNRRSAFPGTGNNRIRGRLRVLAAREKRAVPIKLYKLSVDDVSDSIGFFLKGSYRACRAIDEPGSRFDHLVANENDIVQTSAADEVTA